MRIAGIVAEYNPFHAGHAHHLEMTRRYLGEQCAIVCVMSGNWVQRGEAAIADKWTRTALALRGGADLVLELPTVWAASSAEHFALGAVAALDAAGVVNTLSFGSESGSLEELNAAAECLLSEPYREKLMEFLRTGAPFAASREKAARACIGAGAACLAMPNNTLGVEYLKALKRLKSPIIPMTVARKGARHDAPDGEEGFRSASALRKLLLHDRWDEAERFLPEGGARLLRSEGLASLSWGERGALARLKSLPPCDFERLPDSGEGLSSRLFSAARQGRSLKEIYDLAKTKRYTHSRVRRQILWAFLGLTAADRPECPAYLRVLGMNETGRQVLRHMKQDSRLPVIVKPAHVRKLADEAAAQFALEARCTDLYNLCRADLGRSSCGMEYRRNPVIV